MITCHLPVIACPLCLHPFFSFKIVGDNIDKTIKPQHETGQHHNQSLHYFHSYAVKDRCGVSQLHDNLCKPDVSTIDTNVVLPSDEDLEILRGNMTILMGRVVRKRCTFFKKNLSHIKPHIEHQFSKEMAKQSEVVSI